MQRLLSITLLSSRRLSELAGMRMARVYAIGLLASFVLLIAVLPASTGPQVLGSVLARALGTASWIVAGLSALSAARDLRARDDTEGISTLAALRGHDARSLELSRWIATALRIAVGVGLPVLLLTLFGCLRLREPSSASWAPSWVAFVVGYSVVLGAALALLARSAAWLNPRRGRLLLALVVLLPELARLVAPATPSVPRAFAWALAHGRTLVGHPPPSFLVEGVRYSPRPLVGGADALVRARLAR